MPDESIGWLPGTKTWGWFSNPEAPVGSVLLAAPFGEERKCALRLQINAARALTEQGFRCLRVDYSGVGDSGGEHAEATMSQWIAELSEAVAFLKREAQGPCLGIGARLGGNLLLEVPSLDAVSCWEPIPSGADYVEELQRRRAIKASSGGGGGNAQDFDGYAVSEIMLKELSDLDLDAQLQKQLDRSIQLLHVTGAREPFGHWRTIADQTKPPHLFQLVRERPFWGRVDSQPREELLRATTHFLLNTTGIPAVADA